MGFGKDGKGVIMYNNDTITLGALASHAAVKQTNPLAIEEDFRVLKMRIVGGLDSTTGEEGPIVLGIADNELSAAEIAECWNAEGPLDRNDNLKDERAHRPVFILCNLEETAFGDGKYVFDVEENIRWTFSNTEGFCIFAFNLDGAALTTGGVVRFLAKFYGVWVT